MKAKGIAYWTTTTIVALALLSGGAAQLAHQRENVAGIVLLIGNRAGSPASRTHRSDRRNPCDRPQTRSGIR
jgi:hypothetical protein